VVSLQQTIAALDVGSTTVQYAAGRPDGAFVTPVRSEPTRAGELEAQVVECVGELDKECSGVDVVSVSTTGLVDRDRARIVEFDADDGTVEHGVELGARLADEFDVRTHLDNDCNMAVLGERFFGDGREYEAVVHLTMATGIGAGVFVHGTLLRGERGEAGEVGHLPVGGPDCVRSMGVTDLWEAYCSGRGIEQFAAELLADEERETSLRDAPRVTAEALFDAAAAGDPVAVEYLDRIHQFNAAGVAGIANAYDPGLVTIGGAVALNNPDAVLDGIESRLDEFTYGSLPEVELTPLGADVELYGALAYPTYESESAQSAAAAPRARSAVDTDGGTTGSE